MTNVVELRSIRERRQAEEHAHSLALYECATRLAREGNEELVALVGRLYGADYLEKRVRDAVPRNRAFSR